MIVFYSGDGCNISHPEIFFGLKANVMLTAYTSIGKKKPEQRFRRLVRRRRKANTQGKQYGNNGQS